MGVWRLGGVRRLASLASGLAALVLVLLALPVSSASASLARTQVPYMGWNPYYASEGGANEATFEAVASSLSSTGLEHAGYRIFGSTTAGPAEHGTARGS
jgi:hypothetical protein